MNELLTPKKGALLETLESYLCGSLDEPQMRSDAWIAHQANEINELNDWRAPKVRERRERSSRSHTQRARAKRWASNPEQQPGSQAKVTITFLTDVYSSIAYRDMSFPYPDFFTPPCGISLQDVK